MSDISRYSLAPTQGVHIGDRNDPGVQVGIGASSTSADVGLTVRDPRMDDVVAALNEVVAELQAIRFHLNLVTEFEE